MFKFARTLSKLGQTVPFYEKVDPKSYLPGKSAVSKAVKEMAQGPRKEFVQEMQRGSFKSGGAVSVDRMHVKVSVKHFIDFTVHYMFVTRKKGHEEPMFEFKNKTLMLVEGPEIAIATNI